MIKGQCSNDTLTENLTDHRTIIITATLLDDGISSDFYIIINKLAYKVLLLSTKENPLTSTKGAPEIDSSSFEPGSLFDSFSKSLEQGDVVKFLFLVPGLHCFLFTRL